MAAIFGMHAPKLDVGSLEKVCGSIPQELAVYGFSHAGWHALMDAARPLGMSNNPVQRLFTWELSNPLSTTSQVTLKGRSIVHLSATPTTASTPVEQSPKIIKDICKTTLTNLVLENTFRKQAGQPIIPIVFALEKASTEQEQRFNPLCLTEKDGAGPMTKGELRRAWKMVSDPSLPEHVKTTARESFKFVRVNDQGGEQIALESMPAPWDTPGFEPAWRESYKPRDRSDASMTHWRRGVQFSLHLGEYFSGQSVHFREAAFQALKEDEPNRAKELMSLSMQCRDAVFLSREEQHELIQTITKKSTPLNPALDPIDKTTEVNASFSPATPQSLLPKE